MPCDMVLMCAIALVVLAGHARVERREDAVRIFSVKPDMPIVMGLEIVRLVNGCGGIVDHGVVCNAVK